MFQIQYKIFLLALAAIPFFLLLYFYLIKWKKNTAAKIGDAHLVKAITSSFSSSKYLQKFILVVLAFTMIVLAAANLRKPGGLQNINRSGVDVMIALDVSKSMLAEDIKPSRLDRAKQLLTKLTAKLDGNRIGLVLFAGNAYLQMPLTADQSAAKLFISSINTDIIPTQGTVISDALEMCNESFSTKEKKYKTILLISDGEDHDAASTSIAAQLFDEGVIINTVGIGSEEGAPIILTETGEFKKDKDGNTVISKLNADLLKQIATKTNGTYNHLTNSDETTNAIINQIMGMEKRNIADNSLINYQSFFQWFLALALLLLVIDLFISERKKNQLKKLKPLNIIFFLLIPFLSYSQSDTKLILKGNEAYEKKDYTTAINKYRLVDQNNPIAQFNLGNALYKSKKLEEALAAFENVLKLSKDRLQRSMAFYNKGVLLQNMNKLEDCIAAYKDALRLNPNDDDARQNLQTALKKLQKPKKKKDNTKPNKPKEDKQKKPDKPKEGQQQPKPQPARISKQDAEETLKRLAENEKAVQDKMQKVKAGSSNKPEKDW